MSATATATATATAPTTKGVTMNHTAALFTGVSPYDRELAIIAELENALKDGKRLVHVVGSWQTYKGRAEIQASIDARRAAIA